MWLKNENQTKKCGGKTENKNKNEEENGKQNKSCMTSGMT